jgi:transposase
MASKHEWARRIARWEKSGLSRAEFAARAGVRPEALSWWRWALRRRPHEASKTALVPRVSFVEVQALEVPPGSGDRIEVALLNGRVVRVPGAFDEEALRRVLLAAEGA